LTKAKDLVFLSHNDKNDSKNKSRVNRVLNFVRQLKQNPLAFARWFKFMIDQIPKDFVLLSQKVKHSYTTVKQNLWP